MPSQHKGSGPLDASTGTIGIDVSAAAYTGWLPVLTIEPPAALKRVRVQVDLDVATTGFATVFSTATLRLAIARKVDGTNWRRDYRTATVALAGDNADGFSVVFDLEDVDPTQDARLELILSAETGDFTMTYRVEYEGPAPTLTAVSIA